MTMPEPEDGLRDRARQGGTPLLDKLAALTDDEWAELTHRMSKHFERELHRRGLVIVAADGLTETRR